MSEVYRFRPWWNSISYPIGITRNPDRFCPGSVSRSACRARRSSVESLAFTGGGDDWSGSELMRRMGARYGDRRHLPLATLAVEVPPDLRLGQMPATPRPDSPLTKCRRLMGDTTYCAV